MLVKNVRSGKNAFLHFMDDFRRRNPNRRQSELFREAGFEWRQMSFEAKLKYFELAKPLRTAGGDQPGIVSEAEEEVNPHVEPPVDALVDVLKRGAPLRDGHYLEARRRKLPAAEQNKQLGYMHMRIIGITILVCMTAYFIIKSF